MQSRLTARVLAACLQALGLVAILAVPGWAQKPDVDPTYANGTTVYMIAPKIIANPAPNLLAQAPPLYLLVYPVNPTGSTTLGRITLPSGYQPQCDPCFHPGLPLPLVYHDHLITGAPGFGKDGTAGSFKGPWRLVIMIYNPAVALAPGFQPITSDEDLDAAKAVGAFLPVSSGPDPYEIETGSVVICPVVSAQS
jgi:hypothetical protein